MIDIMARTMTDENAASWANIAKVHQIQRLTDWANMLEARMKELDPLYRGYRWGLELNAHAEKKLAQDGKA